MTPPRVSKTFGWKQEKWNHVVIQRKAETLGEQAPLDFAFSAKSLLQPTAPISSQPGQRWLHGPPTSWTLRLFFCYMGVMRVLTSPVNTRAARNAVCVT